MTDNAAERYAIDALIDSIPKLVLPEPLSKTLAPCQALNCPIDGQEGDEWCSYKHYEERVHHDRFVAFQPNSATLWPGVVVKGKDAKEGLLTPIGVKLAPITFSVSLENLKRSPVGYMDEPSLSSFREARNDILAGGVTGDTPASIDIESIEIHSQSQISTALGAGIDWPGAQELAGSFNFGSGQKRTKILVNFTQAYYTIDVDSPTSPKDFFDPSVTVDDVRPYVDADNPPLYVQSITYGRRVIFSVESTETADNVKAALDATYKEVIALKGKVSPEQKATLSAATIRAFVVGGSGEDATGAITGFDGIAKYIKNGGNYSKTSPGAPIAYKLSYLDNTVTRLSFGTEYSERECTRNRGTLRIRLTKLDTLSSTDGANDKNLEVYGFLRIRYPTESNPVLSCQEGGTETTVWQLSSSQFQEIQAGSPWFPDTVSREIANVMFRKSQKICVSMHLWERDLLTDDDLGYEEKLIDYELGWGGRHLLHLRGLNNDAVDVTVDVETL